MRRTLTTLALSTIGVLALSACSGGGGGDAGDAPDPDSPTPITVGVIPIVDVAPIYLAEAEGFFDEVGLDVTLELAQGGAAIVPAVVSGDYQFGFSNNTSLLLAVNNGIPLKAVSPGVFTTGTDPDFGAVVVPEGSDIESAADLEGVTVAVNTLNNIGDSTVRAAVDKDGGDASAVEFVEMGFPDMPAAIAGGQVDAAWVVEPHLTRALEQGATVISWNWVEADPDLMVASYFTSQQYASDNPEVVAAFQEAMEKAFAYIEENPDALRDILSEYTDIDDATKEAMTMPKVSAEFDEGSLALLADLALTYGMVDSEIDYSSLLP